MMTGQFSERIVEPLAYHRRVASHFRESEPALWKWFADSEHRVADGENLRLELLKSTYRLDRDGHPALFEILDELSIVMNLTGTIFVYQTQIGEGFNASLCYLPGEAHIVLAGPVLTVLSADELRGLLAHELAHYLLLSQGQDEFLVASDMIRGLAADAAAGPEHLETARLWNLYTELYCDRWALKATEDLGAAVRTLVKAQTGLADVNAESYLRQAAEVLRSSPGPAEHFTHPELYIRARALELWYRRGEDAAAEIDSLIRGKLGLSKLDVLAQRSARELTAAMLDAILGPPWMRTEANLAHARQFFPDFATRRTATADIRETLKTADGSLVDYACFLLLDFATVDRELGEAAVAGSLRTAQEWGIDDRFAELAQKELGFTKKIWGRLVKEAGNLVEQAAKAAAEESAT